ncbi:hypothetical protein FD755_014643 [Muntiacus reevesi]|uniref:Uncharacterized protein n=1 Tax=Muntiacus reevesi TaxID=9886 RepID=A0A5N3XMC2_MUNRE|nr:hypothetical protein FD755_014643 [Muntiacus reevesi]
MMNARGLGSQLKDSIPVTELSASGAFESHDLLRKGFSCVKNELPSHPLELSEKNYQLSQDKMNFSTLRNIQGLFAQLKLQMEFKAVYILNDPSQTELMGEPHLMLEYKLGLL